MVENAAPEIGEVQITDKITEGDEIRIRAIATDTGNETNLLNIKE